MASVSLNASNRAVDGKGAARKVRKAGKLPGVIYHHGQQAAAVTVDAHELELVFHKTKNPNTLIEMHLDDGSKRLCLVREVQRHPVSQMMRHVDFYEVSADSPVDITACRGQASPCSWQGDDRWCDTWWQWKPSICFGVRPYSAA